MANEAIIWRSKSGDADARCCSNSPAGSTLCGAAIVVILSLSSLVGTHEDHAVAVSRHDATPFTSEGLVHHLRGRNQRRHEFLFWLHQLGGDRQREVMAWTYDGATLEHPPVDGPDDAERRDHTEFVAFLIPGLDMSAGLADALDAVANYTATTDRLAHLLHLREGLREALAAGADWHSTRAVDTDAQNATIRPWRRLRQCALPGCEVMIEQVPGQPPRKYCSPAHRAARHAARRGGQDDDQINDLEYQHVEKRSALALLRTASDISYPDSDAVARPVRPHAVRRCHPGGVTHPPRGQGAPQRPQADLNLPSGGAPARPRAAPSRPSTT